MIFTAIVSFSSFDFSWTFSVAQRIKAHNLGYFHFTLYLPVFTSPGSFSQQRRCTCIQTNAHARVLMSPAPQTELLVEKQSPASLRCDFPHQGQSSLLGVYHSGQPKGNQFGRFYAFARWVFCLPYVCNRKEFFFTTSRWRSFSLSFQGYCVFFVFCFFINVK